MVKERKKKKTKKNHVHSKEDTNFKCDLYLSWLQYLLLCLLVTLPEVRMCRRWSCVFPKEENRIGRDMMVVFWSNALLSRDESSWTGLAVHHFSVFVDILLEGAWSCTPFGQTPVKAAGGRLRSHRCDGFPPPSPKLLNDMSKGIEQLLPASTPVKGGCYGSLM